MAQIHTADALSRRIGSGRPLIAAHRGTEGMNIPCNTLEAYTIALRQGADIIETDVAKTADGELIIFHTGTEDRQFNDKSIDVTKLTAAEVRALPLHGSNLGSTQYHVPTLDEALETLKGKCLINLDRSWDIWEDVLKVVDRHTMREQILLKSAPGKKYYDFLEECAPDVAYLPILSHTLDGWEEAEHRAFRLAGAELVFKTEDSPLCQPEFFQRMHQAGRVAWGNAIVFDYRTVLAGGHTDDQAVLGDLDGGWGWFVDQGFDIIQTDWTRELALYLDGRCAR